MNSVFNTVLLLLFHPRETKNVYNMKLLLKKRLFLKLLDNNDETLLLNFSFCYNLRVGVYGL